MNNPFSGGNLEKLLGNAHKMQEEMENAKKQLGTLQVVGVAGGGMVRITMNGERHVLNVEINPECLGDNEMLQDLVVAAVNDALTKTEKSINEKLQSSLSGTLGKFL